jgi:hypothetical protein
MNTLEQINYIWQSNGHTKKMFRKKQNIKGIHFLAPKKPIYYNNLKVGSSEDVDHSCRLLVRADLMQRYGEYVVDATVYDKAFRVSTRDWQVVGQTVYMDIYPQVFNLYLSAKTAEYTVHGVSGKSLKTIQETKPPEYLEQALESASLTEISLKNYVTVLSAIPQIAEEIFNVIKTHAST